MMKFQDEGQGERVGGGEGGGFLEAGAGASGRVPRPVTAPPEVHTKAGALF